MITKISLQLVYLHTSDRERYNTLPSLQLTLPPQSPRITQLQHFPAAITITVTTLLQHRHRYYPHIIVQPPTVSITTTSSYTLSTIKTASFTQPPPPSYRPICLNVFPEIGRTRRLHKALFQNFLVIFLFCFIFKRDIN